MEQATKLTNLAEIPVHVSPQRPSQVQGTSHHPQYAWLQCKWAISYTKNGLDAAFAHVYIVGHDGDVIDQMFASSGRDHVWYFDAHVTRQMNRLDAIRRRLVIETLIKLTEEIDASGWRGLSHA